MSQRIKLEGKVYGLLTVMEYIGDAKYLCKCVCGNKCVVDGANIRKGHTKSCGCAKYVDLTGNIYGNLKVLERAKPKLRGRKKYTVWRCECLLCGNKTEVYHDSLVSGCTTSCGCSNLKKDMPQKIKDTFADGTQIVKLCAEPTRANKSGVVGVNWDKSRNKWQVGIRFRGHRYNLGRYSDFAEACKVRKNAEKELHGNFLELYAKEHPDKTQGIKKENCGE